MRISKEKKAEIRRRIIKEAKPLFLTKGFDKTSTAKIAKKAGVAEGTLFNYFPSKTDIFLEAVADEISFDELKQTDSTSEDPTEVIFDFVMDCLNLFFKMPKFLIIQIGTAFIKLGEKNPKLLKKLMELDFKFMEKATNLITDLKNKSLIKKDCDSKLLSETIYSVVMFEFFMFAYEKKATKKSVKDNIKRKIEFTLKGYKE